MKLNRIGRFFFILLGVLITGNAVIATFLSNIHMGILLTYAVGIIFLLCGVFFAFVMRVVPKPVKYIFAIGVLAVTAFVLVIFLYGNSDNVSCREDAVIVLGAGIRGEELSENLKNRLDRAIGYHAQNPDAVIVVSGGQGPQEDITEALAMERYLIKQGIPKGSILKEEYATSTGENFRNSKDMLDSRFDEAYSVAFITNDYHVYRAENIAKLAGFESITHCHNATAWYMVIPNGLRECLAIVKLWILGE